MRYDPLDGLRRRHRRQQRLGPDARCAMCGETNPECLMQVRRSILEQHHVAGEAHEPGLTIVVCRNCHARFSAAQQDDGVPLTPQSTELEHVNAAIKGIGSALRVIGDGLLRLGDRADGVITRLDAAFPDWRKHI